jgi:hypothetical protein
MNHRFTLDVPSFQKLLEAAWVLQSERDHELSASHSATALALSCDKDERFASLPPSSPDRVLEPPRAVAAAHTPQIEILNPSNAPSNAPNIAPSVDPSVAAMPLTVAPIYQQTEVAGALALAANLDCSPLPDPAPFLAPDGFKKPARGTHESAVAHIGRRALSLVPFRNKDNSDKDRDKNNAAFNFQRASRISAAYAGPVVVLAILLAFLSSMLGIHTPALTAVKAARLLPKTEVDKIKVDNIVLDNLAVDNLAPGKIAADKIAPGKIAPDKIAADKIAANKIEAQASPTLNHVGQPQSTAPEAALPDPTVPEPSHLRVTDPAVSSLVESLSRYEIETVRQQAQYGDAAAALTLGMAYEIGRHVPRSCTEAAHWVAVAANEGNPAAQYNLALRYISGDGTPADLDQARNWLEKAARLGYQKARLTLQASR